MTGQKAIIQFQTVRRTSSVTRPANTTAYSAGDTISNVTTNGHFEFDAVVDPGGPLRSGCVSTARVRSSANQAQKPELELWLFDVDPTAIADNAAFAPSDAELDNLVGIIDFPASAWRAGNAGSGADGNSVCEATNLGLVFKLSATSLYGMLVVRDPGTPYTPVSGEVFSVDLIITKD